MQLPDGWISVVHPEGSRYFMNRKQVRWGHLSTTSCLTRNYYDEQRIFTESDICDSKLYKEIEYGIKVLFDWLKPNELDMDQLDLVIERRFNDNDDIVFWYYFVNHQSRCIFWLDDFDAEEVLLDCQGVRSLSHKGQ